MASTAEIHPIGDAHREHVQAHVRTHYIVPPRKKYAIQSSGVHQKNCLEYVTPRDGSRDLRWFLKCHAFELRVSR